MPTYRTLMKEYGVSLITIRQAVDLLKSEGLIRTVHGRGIFASVSPSGEKAPVLPAAQRKVNVVITSTSGPDPTFNPLNWHVPFGYLQGIVEGAREFNLSASIIGKEDMQRYQDTSRKEIFVFPGLWLITAVELQAHGHRCIWINPEVRRPGYNVMVETEQGTYDAIKGLLNSGRRRIALLRSPQPSEYHLGRLRGFFRAHEDAGIPHCPELFEEAIGSVESGYIAMQRLLQIKPLPDAVFGTTDMRAIGAMKAIHEIGLRIPDDIAVVGFDDIPEAQMCRPPLATVHFPGREAGFEAMRLASMLMDGAGDVPDEIFLHAEYVLRESAAVVKG